MGKHPATHPPPPLWTELVFPIYLYNNMICIENFDNLTNHLPDLNLINTTILNLKQMDTGDQFRAIMALLFIFFFLLWRTW